MKKSTEILLGLGLAALFVVIVVVGQSLIRAHQIKVASQEIRESIAEAGKDKTKLKEAIESSKEKVDFIKTHQPILRFGSGVLLAFESEDDYYDNNYYQDYSDYGSYEDSTPAEDYSNPEEEPSIGSDPTPDYEEAASVEQEREAQSRNVSNQSEGAGYSSWCNQLLEYIIDPAGGRWENDDRSTEGAIEDFRQLSITMFIVSACDI